MMTSSFERFAAASRARAEAAMKTHPLDAYEDLLQRLPPVRPFAGRLTRAAGPLPRIIAGMYRSRPDAASPREGYAPRRIALGYARVGAAALSVPTEPDAFGGELSHLVEVKSAHLPVLRNDFLVTPYQVAESRAAGADAVLLIAGMLSGPPLGIMLHAARRYEIEALVEVRDENELGAAIDAGASSVVVKGSDARGAPAHTGACLRLAKRIPGGVTAVADNGIGTRDDLQPLLDAGYEAFLVDEALMSEQDPGDALWKIMQPA